MKNTETKWLSAYDFDPKYWDCDEAFINFEVPVDWLRDWFDKNRKGEESNGNIEKDCYETLEDWLDDYILDEMDVLYCDALTDGVILNEEHVNDWKDRYLPD